MGVRSGLPKSAAVEEKTNRLTPAASIASSRVSALAVLLRKKVSGVFMDSPASISAAKCMTASIEVEESEVEGIEVEGEVEEEAESEREQNNRSRQLRSARSPTTSSAFFGTASR